MKWNWIIFNVIIKLLYQIYIFIYHTFIKNKTFFISLKFVTKQRKEYEKNVYQVKSTWKICSKGKIKSRTTKSIIFFI